MHIFCNAGVNTTDIIGDIPELGEVWYQSKGIENILSMKLIKKDYQVIYDGVPNITFRVWNEGKTKY